VKTKFKLIFENASHNFDIELFIQSLPPNFEIEKKGDVFFILIPSDNPEDKKCQFLIDRELDLHFFLTSVRIKASMITRLKSVEISTSYRIYGKLPENIAPQNWTYKLPLQLRLWAIASDSNVSLLKIILYFQIIELAYPNNSAYPPYTDRNMEPDTLTECKMLRNLAAHSGEAFHSQQKLYCEYLGLPPLLHDPTDSAYAYIFDNKLQLLREEAHKAIEKLLF